MKNLFLIGAISALSLSILSFTDGNNNVNTPVEGTDVSFEIPTDVQATIDNSCYGCHNSESKSTKGKAKLNFDKLPTMKTSKQVGKLMKISKVVTNDKMPPEKFLAKYPDHALTEDDAKKLVSWADDLAQKFGGE